MIRQVGNDHHRVTIVLSYLVSHVPPTIIPRQTQLIHTTFSLATTAKIWSVEKGGDSGLLHDLRGHLKEIYTVRWTPTGPMSANPTKPLLLCTASFDGTGNTRARAPHPSTPITSSNSWSLFLFLIRSCIAFFVCLFVCVVKAWSAITGGVVYNLRRQAQPVYSIAPSPTGDYIATGSLGGYVSVWSLHDGSLVHESKGGTNNQPIFFLLQEISIHCMNIPFFTPSSGTP